MWNIAANLIKTDKINNFNEPLFQTPKSSPFPLDNLLTEKHSQS